MSVISNSSSSGYLVATRTIVTKRIPNKTRKGFRPGENKTACNVFTMRIRCGEFFAEDGRRALFWNFLGTQKKAWCTAFDRAVQDENAWPTGDSPILNIVTRIDITEEDEDVLLA